MKTQSTVEIPVIQDLGTGRFYFHFNHHTIERKMNDKVEVINEADTVLVIGDPTEKSIIAAMKKEGYAVSDEMISRIKLC